MDGTKKRRLRFWIGLAAALLVSVLLLSWAQWAVTPRYSSEQSPEGNLIRAYYAEADVPHDVLFIGDCEVYENFIPAVLWEEYGIRSYVRGSPQQLVWQSYYLLREMLTYETPKVVVFNVLAVKYGTPQNEAYNRLTLDGMKASPNKWKAVKASMTEGESFLSYVFPLLRYHSRWSELGIRDWFCPASGEEENLFFNGYMLQTDIVPESENPTQGKDLLDYTLPAASMEYLEKMADLCRSKGITLILIKAPTNNWRYWWYDEWDEQMAAFAREQDLPYYNLISDREAMGLDFSHDSYDGGIHLNVYGAEKLTKYFGALLSNTFSVPDYRSDPDSQIFWNDALERFRAEKERRESQSE